MPNARSADARKDVSVGTCPTAPSSDLTVFRTVLPWQLHTGKGPSKSEPVQIKPITYHENVRLTTTLLTVGRTLDISPTRLTGAIVSRRHLAPLSLRAMTRQPVPSPAVIAVEGRPPDLRRLWHRRDSSHPFHWKHRDLPCRPPVGRTDREKRHTTMRRTLCKSTKGTPQSRGASRSPKSQPLPRWPWRTSA